MDAVGFLSKVSGKFVHEVVPVALASVVGILLVNHYSHRAALPAVVVQPPPPPPAADAVFQALQDEHQLVVDYLKREADAKRVANANPDGARIPAVRWFAELVNDIASQRALLLALTSGKIDTEGVEQRRSRVKLAGFV